SSTLRPAMPPVELMWSTANCVPLRPHSPMVPAMPARGARIPMRSGAFWAKAGALVHGWAAAMIPVPPRACNSFLRLLFMGCSSLDVRGVAGELLDHVDQLVARALRGVPVALGDGACDVGVQLRGERHVGGLLVVDIPEAARERMHEAHRAGGELVVRRRAAERVELAVDAHEPDVVVHARGLLEALRELAKPGALLGRRAARGAARDQPLQLPAHLEQSQLALHVDAGDDDAAARKDRDQALAGEALQGFPDGRAADAEVARKLRFRDRGPGRDAQRDDPLLQVRVGAVREARGRALQCCLRFSTRDRNFSYSF